MSPTQAANLKTSFVALNGSSTPKFPRGVVMDSGIPSVCLGMDVPHGTSIIPLSVVSPPLGRVYGSR